MSTALLEVTMNITLPPAQQKLVDRLMKRGKYASGSEVVCAGLELLRDHEQSSEESLKREIQKGLDDIEAGRSVVLRDDELDDFFKDIKRRGRERLAARKKAGDSGRATRQ